MSRYARRRVLGAARTAGALSTAGGVLALALAACGQQQGSTAGGAVADSGGASSGGGASGSGTSGSAGGDKPPVTIGAAVSSTGSNAKAGQMHADAYRLWEEQVNQRGGLLGRPVKLVIEDDGSDPAAGARLYDKLINADKVELALGPYANSVTQAASTVTEKAHYPLLAAGASAADIWKRNYRYVFGVYASEASHFNGVIDLAVKQGYKSVAIVYEDTLLPVAAANGAAAYAKSKGLQVVYQEKYSAKVSDVSAQIGKMKALNPEVVLGGSYEPDTILIIRQMKEADLAPKLLAFSVGGASQEVADQLGKDAEGVFGPSMWEPALKTPGNKEFVESYQRKWSRAPDFHAATGFATGQILEAAVKKANALDRDKLRDALAGLETATILPGKYKVDDAGAQAGHTPVVVQWQGKDKAIVWPDDLKTGVAKLPLPPWTAR